MKIAFVVSEDESLGVGYLSSYLKSLGHSTYLIFDPRSFERSSGQSTVLYRLFNVEGKNIERLKKIEPDIIAFSTLTSNYQWALEMASKIKRRMRTPIIFGGFHATLVPDIVLRNDCVNMVCIGEGEKAFAELLKNWKTEKRYETKNIWFKRRKRIIKNGLMPLIQDLDSLPFPDKEMFYKELPGDYSRHSSIITSRGCPYACSYCGNNALRKIYSGKGCYVRQRSVGNVIQELVVMKGEYHTNYVFFMDDVFGMRIGWLREFMKRYKSEVGLPFSCFGHFKLHNEESLSMLKSGGCRLLMFGLQSGSERIRENILNRHEKNSDVERVSEICHRLNIRFSVDHIINIPTETEEDILESLRLYNKIRPNVVNIYGLLYFPKTEIIDKAKDAGILNKDIDNAINNGMFTLYHSAILTSHGKNLEGNYRRYALLFSILPLVPKRLMGRIIEKPGLRSLFARMPLFFVPAVKIIVNFRVGLGFLPVSVVRNELFFAYKSIKIKMGV